MKIPLTPHLVARPPRNLYPRFRHSHCLWTVPHLTLGVNFPHTQQPAQTLLFRPASAGTRHLPRYNCQIYTRLDPGALVQGSVIGLTEPPIVLDTLKTIISYY